MEMPEPPVGDDIVADLKRRYGEPRRAYHDWSHIAAMLDLAGEVSHLIAEPRAFHLAILFHDAVYDPRASDNERRSAALMRAQLAGRESAETLDRAEALILATEKHLLPAGGDARLQADIALFLDLDLSILGADAVRFAAYDAAIRQEYAHVPPEAYRVGRKAVLERFLGRERIYFTDHFRDRFEAAARANLAQAIARL